MISTIVDQENAKLTTEKYSSTCLIDQKKKTKNKLENIK